MVRFKNRYFLLSVASKAEGSGPANEATAGRPLKRAKGEAEAQAQRLDVNSKDLFHALKEAIVQQFGEYGWGLSMYALQVKYFNSATGLSIVRMSRAHADLVKHSIPHVCLLRNVPVTVSILHVGATIKNCQRAAIQHDRKMLEWLAAHQESEADDDDEEGEADDQEDDDPERRPDAVQKHAESARPLTASKEGKTTPMQSGANDRKTDAKRKR